jgi:hypothetical protein
MAVTLKILSVHSHSSLILSCIIYVFETAPLSTSEQMHLRRFSLLILHDSERCGFSKRCMTLITEYERGIHFKRDVEVKVADLHGTGYH